MTHPEDSATIDRDLEAVDTALTTGRTGHDSAAARELQELALALAAEAPQPSEDFAARMRERVTSELPAARQARRRRRSPALLMRDFGPAAGLAATILLIVGVVLVAGGSSNDNGGSSGDLAAGGGGAESGATAGDQALQAPQAQGFAPGQPNRRIERSYSMELSVPVKEMARVGDRVSSVAYRHGGFVLSSSVDTGTDSGGGDFSLRIPTDQLRPALRDLGELAPVTSQSQSGRDVTREQVTAKERLQAARAERRSLLRRLEKADTDAETEALRRRLDLVSGQINGLRAQLRDLRLRTNYAVVDVTLAAAKKDSGELGSLGDSFHDAGNLLAGFAGVTIRVLALALPLGAITLVAWLTARTLRRRRRESALV
jgi:hypothetical protein